MKLIKEDCNEALYGREEIDDYLKKMKEIGVKNLGDLRKFKQNVKSDLGKDVDSDIEQIRMYRDALGKDFKIKDEEPKKKVVGEKLDLDEALGLADEKFIKSPRMVDQHHNAKMNHSVKRKNESTQPKLSVEDVRELALEHYIEGGVVVVECWTDEDIMLWLEEHPTKEELLDLFSKYYDHYQDMRGYGDYAILDKEDSEDSTDDEQELYQDYYDEEDFGPSNPWDAPGMSIKDFLR